MTSRMIVRDPWLGNGVHRRRDEFFSPVEQYFNKFFDEFFKSDGASSVKASAGFPRMNISEEEGHLVVRAVVPGVASQDLKVELVPPTMDTSGSLLRISGKMSEVHENKDAVYHVKELKQSSFCREFYLPNYVKDDPDASLKDGVLTLRWPMTNVEPTPTTRQIQFKTE